jgi:hypothetical protein
MAPPRTAIALGCSTARAGLDVLGWLAISPPIELVNDESPAPIQRDRIRKSVKLRDKTMLGPPSGRPFELGDRLVDNKVAADEELSGERHLQRPPIVRCERHVASAR